MTDGIRLIDPTPEKLRAALEDVYVLEYAGRGIYSALEPLDFTSLG